MSEAKHTPGRLEAAPWGNSDCSGWDLTIDGHLLTLSDIESATEDEAEANALRIAACWNACEGLDTELLENILMLGDTLKSRFAARDQIDKELQARRDELLTALCEMVEFFQPNAWGSNENRTDALANARAAISKATGGES